MIKNSKRPFIWRTEEFHQMTLYEAILSYETNQIHASFDRMQEKSNFLKAFLRKGHRDKEIQKLHILVDAAYALGKTELTEEQLDTTFSEVIDKDSKLEKMQLALNGNYVKVNPSRRAFVREAILFYQKLASQEGEATSFQEACRNQFETYQNLEAAYDQVTSALETYLLQFGSTVKAIREVGIDKMSIEVAKERAQRRITEVFGEIR